MKKYCYKIYILLFFLLCVLPGCAMLFSQNREAKANQILAPFPQIKAEGGGVNMEFFTQLNDYISENFGFRQEMITADHMLTAKLFQVSGTDKVILGKQGWLFYTETLEDFKGIPTMTERQYYAAARSLALMQEYFRKKGSRFLFTIAPNKNSLYPQFMPYYAQQLWNEGNAEKLEKQIRLQQVEYADLFYALSKEQAGAEILYHSLDSHWNNRGAVLAYKALTERLDIEPEDFEKSGRSRNRTFSGDLYEMVYPKGTKKDWNFRYGHEFQYRYAEPVKDHMDIEIHTLCKGKKGSLVMFRDSFGNAILPFLAESFSKGYFTRQVPYDLEAASGERPDAVVLELVERNISQLAQTAPVMEAPLRDVKIDQMERAGKTKTDKPATFSMKSQTYSDHLIKLTGQLCQKPDEDSNIYISIEKAQYEAFPINEFSEKEADSGFTLYVPSDIYANREIDVKVSYKKDGKYQSTRIQRFKFKE